MGLEQVKLITDHKPLVPLINRRSLDNVPIWFQGLLMRLISFNAVAEYAPGKTLLFTDTLSRSPQAGVSKVSDTDSKVAFYVASIVGAIPTSKSKMQEIKDVTAADAELMYVMQLIRSGWPKPSQAVPNDAKAYIQVRAELSEYDNLVPRGS